MRLVHALRNLQSLLLFPVSTGSHKLIALRQVQLIRRLAAWLWALEKLGLVDDALVLVAWCLQNCTHTVVVDLDGLALSLVGWDGLSLVPLLEWVLEFLGWLLCDYFRETVFDYRLLCLLGLDYGFFSLFPSVGVVCEMLDEAEFLAVFRWLFEIGATLSVSVSRYTATQPKT